MLSLKWTSAANKSLKKKYVKKKAKIKHINTKRKTLFTFFNVNTDKKKKKVNNDENFLFYIGKKEDIKEKVVPIK